MFSINDFLDKIRRAPYEPRFYGRIPGSHVLDQEITTHIIEPKKSYFEVRLSEMFLRDKRQYWTTYIPFVVVLTEFLHDHETAQASREALPFLVTNHLLGNVEKYVGDDHVEYRNTRVAGPLPYMGDDVDFFVALYGARGSDVSERLFDFLGSVVGLVDAGGLSSYLNIARNLKESLASLLNISGTQYRMGKRDSFTDRPGDPKQFKEGYIAYINCPAHDVKKEELWVREHSLLMGPREDPEPFRAHDYCLIRIDERKDRNHESLPFHRLWKQVEELIRLGHYAEADVFFRHLVREVAKCPDLTKQHRIHLPLIYKADFEAAIDQENELRGAIPKDLPATRGPRTGLSPKAVLQRTASIAKKARMPEAVQDSLWKVSQVWDDIPHLKNRPKEFRLTGDILNAQLEALARMTDIPDQNPEDLPRALAIEMAG